jgi:hypothetical protein
MAGKRTMSKVTRAFLIASKVSSESTLRAGLRLGSS